MEPMDDSILGYGKYITWKYKAVFEADLRYCNWTLATAENGDSSKELQHFAHYLMTKIPECPDLLTANRATMSQRPASSRGPVTTIAARRSGGPM